MRTKPARRSFKPHALAIAVSAAFLPHALAQIPPAPDTLPTYGHVAHGAARISQTPGNMQIQQSSDKAVLNWQSFSIGSNAAVNFQQPASSSVALNRVLGNDPSQIYGSLTATGRVFLVNPTGIYFAPGANVSVGSLVASTLSITDDDFLAGRYLFSNPGGAESVVNDGNIFSHSGYTALLGPQVANNGFIFANMGSVALAAGDRVSLDMVGDNLIRVNVEQSALDAAVVNTGGIDAFGGNVLLRAHSANALLDTVLNTTGIVRATGLSLQGGEIVLDGGSRGSAAIAGEVTSSGSLTVASGGHVTVAGPVSAGASMSIEVSGGNLDVFAPLSAGGDQSVRVTGGDHILVQGGSGFAGLLAGGSQAVSITGSGRNEIILGSAGALGTSVLNATLQQEIIAGAAGQQGSITLTGPDSFSGFVGITTNSGVGEQTQTVSTSGALRIQSGEALAKSSSTPTGIFHNRQGTQTINAGSIEIRAGGSGSGNSAFANSNGGGDQDVNVTGAIELVGNAGGNAGMNVNTGPFSPRHGDQEIHAGSIFMTNSPGGGFNSTATILGFHQEITTGGDVTMLSGASGGNLAGVRIGGRAETDLDMHIGGTLLMSGGTAPNNGVGIGSSSAGVALPNNIRIEAGGDVILNSGVEGSGARIGSGSNGIAAGDIFVSGRSIQLNGSSATAAIRTTGNVELHADQFGGMIFQGPNGFIVADGLTTSSSSMTSLPGPNQISRFDGTSPFGDILLHNSGALEVTNLSAFSATLVNAGPVTVSGPWFSGFTTSITASDLTVTNTISSGPMTLDIDGAVVVSASGEHDARLTTFGGQSIEAAALSISAQDGRVASMSSFGGEQSVSLVGGSFEALTGPGGGRVEILAFGGGQSISVSDGDHIALSASGGGEISLFSDRLALSITGSGRNAIEFGAVGATGSVFVGGHTQEITAGVGMESGSIAITGTDAPGTSVQIGVPFVPPVPGEQTISTTGALTVTAGSRIGGTPFLTGIAHGGQGPQSISAGRVELRGGPGGSANPASIISSAGGEQRIDVAGDLVLVGGPGGSANLFSSGAQRITAANILVQGASAGANNGAFITTNPGVSQYIEVPGQITVRTGDAGTNNGAGINSRGTQTIVGRPDINVIGGAGATAATIQGLGGLQTIEARNIFMTNAESSPINSAAVIQSPLQRIDASGDVTLLSRSGTGTASGVRIGAQGAGATDLVLTVGGNLLLRGGTSGTNGAALGGSGTAPTNRNDIVVIATGDVVLDGASGGGGTRIGSSGATPVQEGNISVAGRSIVLTGSAPAAIRTLGDVELHADQFGGMISQSTNGLILADGLTTTSYGSTTLAGANQVSSYSGTSTSGDVFLNNSGSLDVTNLSAVNATLVNAGPLTISGWWNTFGSTSIETTGPGADLTVTNNVFANGTMEIDVSGDLTVRGSGFTMANLASFGDQVINVTGGSLDIEGFDGAFAQIASHGGDQTVTVRDGDHVRLRSEGGSIVGMSAAGTQSVSITGTGRNAMEFGTEGGTGFVFMSAPTLRLTAGVGSESGSITITGPDAPDTSVQVGAGFPLPVPGEQTISTTGALTVAGGSRPGGMSVVTGIVHNGLGPQTISAGSLELRGGAAGSGNVAAIISLGGGEQRIDVAGDLVLLGGPGGMANLYSSASQAISAANVRLQGAYAGANGGAFVNAFGQNIDVSGDITVAGGSGTNNGAGIHSLGTLQAINASNLRLQGAFGGDNSGAFVNGAGQYIDVSGAIVVAGGSGINNGAGINSAGVQTILGRPDITVTAGVSNFATINAGPGALQIIEADDIRLGNSSGPGNSAGVIQGTHQQIDATGDVTLTAHAAGGELVGARIGGATGSSTDLHLRLDGNLVLTGGSAGQNGASLGGSVTGAALANGIVVRAGGDVILDGANGGAGVRIGASPRVGIAGGNIAIEAANIRILGEAPAAIRTLDNVELRAGDISQGANGVILANALTTESQGATLLAGQNQVSSFSGTATGDLFLRNLSPLLALGPVSASRLLSFDQSGSLVIQAGESPLVVRGGQVNVVTGGDLRLVGGTGYQARAELVSGGDIDATIGGVVALDKGLAEESWARIRSESEGGVMRFTFPNLTSGGFYVDGVEGDIKHGLTGFFILNKPVKIGETLLLEYQQ